MISLVNCIKSKIPVKFSSDYERWLKWRGWKLVSDGRYSFGELDSLPHSYECALRCEAEAIAYDKLKEAGWLTLGRFCYPPGSWTRNVDGGLTLDKLKMKKLLLAIQIIGAEFVE